MKSFRLFRAIYTQTPHSMTNNKTNTSLSMNTAWSLVPLGPPDAILGITEAFRRDTNAEKINLGVGAYRDDQGKPYVLKAVKAAEQKLPQVYPEKEYAGIAGLPEFCKLSGQLAFGNENDVLPKVPVNFYLHYHKTGGNCAEFIGDRGVTDWRRIHQALLSWSKDNLFACANMG